MIKRIVGITLMAGCAFSLSAFAEEAPLAKPSVSTETVAAKKQGAVGAAKVATARGTITQVDTAGRTITLKRPNGEEAIIPIGPEVKNFDQIKVGDQVVFRQLAAIVFELKKSDSKIRSRTEHENVERAQPGEKPAIAATKEVRVVADVTALDKKAGTISLRGPKETRSFKADNPKLLANVKKGDKVEVTYVEGAALSVETAPQMPTK